MVEVSLDSQGRVDDWEEYGSGICARGRESVGKHLNFLSQQYFAFQDHPEAAEGGGGVPVGPGDSSCIGVLHTFEQGGDGI